MVPVLHSADMTENQYHHSQTTLPPVASSPKREHASHHSLALRPLPQAADQEVRALGNVLLGLEISPHDARAWADRLRPELFVEHAARPTEVYELSPEEIGAHREEWIDRWTDLVVR